MRLYLGTFCKCQFGYFLALNGGLVMHNNEKLFKKKFEKVIVDVELNRIDLKLIKLDRELETFCKNFNLLSSLKPSSDDGYESETSILLDSY